MATFIDRLKHAIALRQQELGRRILKKELAEAAGVSPSAVTQWLNGDTEDLKAASLLGIAKFLRVRAEWLRDKAGPIKPNGDYREPDAVPHVPDATLSGVSGEAKALIESIASADRDKTVPKEVLNAFALLFSRATATNASAEITMKRSIRRAQDLVASDQPKRKRGKGAA
jgi:transcriptional regulator with XRE-family HTH domain